MLDDIKKAVSAAEPVSSRNDEAGYVEFLNEDVPYIVRDIQGAVAILMDLETRNVIGYRVYDPDSVFAPPAPSVAVKAILAELDNVLVNDEQDRETLAKIRTMVSALSVQVQDVTTPQRKHAFSLSDHEIRMMSEGTMIIGGAQMEMAQEIIFLRSLLHAAPAKQEGGRDQKS